MSRGTPNRTIRIPDDEWDELRGYAERRAMSPSEAVRNAIRALLKRARK